MPQRSSKRVQVTLQNIERKRIKERPGGGDKRSRGHKRDLRGSLIGS